MASNVQRGTLKMDAGDWTRIKKLNGARGNMYVNYGAASPAPPPLLTGITNPPQVNCCAIKTSRHVYPEFGTSKIRRPASNYTDYKASQIVDYVLQSSSGTCGPGQSLNATRVCDCAISKSVISHNGLCVACKK
jgi:hypothetical protein